MNDGDRQASEIDHGKTGQPPIQRRAKITREAILEVSATLFSRTGYAGTSINDILAVSPTTKGAMYFHFSKKESLAAEMLRGWTAVVSETIGEAEASGQTADRQILMIYRELTSRTENEAINRAGLFLSTDQTLTGARATYEAWTEALTSIVVRAIRSDILACAESTSRLPDTLCACFVGVVKVAVSLDENHTITKRIDDVLLLWCGTDPASIRMIEGASL